MSTTTNEIDTRAAMAFLFSGLESEVRAGMLEAYDRGRRGEVDPELRKALENLFEGMLPEDLAQARRALEEGQERGKQGEASGEVDHDPAADFELLAAVDAIVDGYEDAAREGIEEADAVIAAYESHKQRAASCRATTAG